MPNVKKATYNRLKAGARRGRKSNAIEATIIAVVAGAAVGVAAHFLEPQAQKVQFIKDHKWVVPAGVAALGVGVAMLAPDVAKPAGHAMIGSTVGAMAFQAITSDKATKGMIYDAGATSAAQVFAARPRPMVRQMNAAPAPQIQAAAYMAQAEHAARRRSALLGL